MTSFDVDISGYDPREHRPDLRHVYSGYALLVLVMAGLFLF